MKFKAKKSLGQNFLIDTNIINNIVSLGSIKNEDIVLEIGPGTGNLSEKILLKKPKKLTLVEKDKNLSEILSKKFGDKIHLVNKDFLNLSETFFLDKNMIAFGNLPYNVSTQILAKIIKIKDLEQKFKILIFMFQKEVADRIVAKKDSKNYGRLSILANWRLNIKKIMNVGPKSFSPSPKIESTVLFFEPKKNYFKFEDVNNLEKITNIFFNQRRKMIKKPLNILFKKPQPIIDKLKLDLNSRPQNLSPENYFEICDEFEKNLN